MLLPSVRYLQNYITQRRRLQQTSPILAIIVCHDATGVRRETEKQAYIITELVSAFSELMDDKLPEVKLKRFVGHTPIQVLVGILVGVINAVVLHGILE